MRRGTGSPSLLRVALALALMMLALMWVAIPERAADAADSDDERRVQYGYALMGADSALYGLPLPCDGAPAHTAAASIESRRAVGVSFFQDFRHAGRVRIAFSDGSVNDSSSPAAELRLAAPIVGVTTAPQGLGYWLAGADGGVFATPDAPFWGSMGATTLNAPVVAVAATSTGNGYWLAAADGGVFAFGDAHFAGSLAEAAIGDPIVAFAATPTDQGYWFVNAHGGVIGMGDARYYGSRAGQHLNAPVVGIAATAVGDGYWLAAADGGVFGYGNAPVNLSLANTTRRLPVAAIAQWPQACPTNAN